MVVENWEVEADKYLGEVEGSKYYNLGPDVYKVTDGATRWYCTEAAFLSSPAGREVKL